MSVLFALCFVVLAVGSIVLLAAPSTRPRSLGELGVVVAVAVTVGLGAVLAAGLTDDSVAQRGETIGCGTGLFDDPIPQDLQDRCAAQRADRERQAWIAAGGAALISGAATCLVTTVGPLAQRGPKRSRGEVAH